MKKLLLVVSATLVLSACSSTEHHSETMVYINTGAVQCESEGQTGIQTARVLTDNNIEVGKTQCGQLTNVGVASVCGAKTVNINVHSIPVKDVDTAKVLGFEEVSTLKQQGDLGYQVSNCQ